MLSGLMSFLQSITRTKMLECLHLYGLRDIGCAENQEPQAIASLHVLQVEEVISCRVGRELGKPPTLDE